MRSARFAWLAVAGAVIGTGVAVVSWGASSRAAGGRAAATDPFAFDPELFEKKRPPREDDWLVANDELGQTFAEYLEDRPVRATAQRRVIVIRPMGPFGDEDRRVLEALREYTGIFFQLPVRLEPSRPLAPQGVRRRPDIGPRHVQYRTGELLNELARELPPDAVCLLGVTMMDLYPEPDWNFVFGMSSTLHRVGIYSLARYGGGRSAPERSLFLLRSVKVLAHEAGHMFSMEHCIQNECLMNGSNSLEEMDRQPLHLCPVCLHKLAWNLSFDVRQREARLLQFYRRHDLDGEAAWTIRRLNRLRP